MYILHCSKWYSTLPTMPCGRCGQWVNDPFWVHVRKEEYLTYCLSDNSQERVSMDKSYWQCFCNDKCWENWKANYFCSAMRSEATGDALNDLIESKNVQISEVQSFLDSLKEGDSDKEFWFIEKARLQNQW